MSGLRLICFALGWIMLGLAAAGAVLPLLPTTPFVLAAAWFFCRSSPRMTAWLHSHPVLGRALTNWQRHGAIAIRAKLAAIASMAVGYATTLHFASPGPLLAAGLAAILLTMATFIVTRPTPAMAHR